VTREQFTALREAVSRYRNDVERTLAPRLAPAATELFRAYDALFEYAGKKLMERERTAHCARTIQMTLLIVGSVLAIYAAYLDAVSSKT
jgi:hypothetical protein